MLTASSYACNADNPPTPWADIIAPRGFNDTKTAVPFLFRWLSLTFTRALIKTADMVAREVALTAFTAGITEVNYLCKMKMRKGVCQYGASLSVRYECYCNRKPYAGPSTVL